MARRATQDVKPKAAKKPSRFARVLLWLLGSSVLLVALLWYAVHHFDWAGPLVANSLRAVFGDNTVAKLEDLAYGAEDRVNRVLKKDEPPKAYWNVPSAAVTPSAAPLASASSPPLLDAPPPFKLEDPGPALKDWSAPGDGEWVGVRDARHPEEPPRMLKTLLHPDKGRSWAEVFVIAIDLRQVELFPVAGTQEPQPDSDEAKKYVREGKIPVASQPTLLAAFNGGFMTEHGGYGMKLDGVTIAKPKPRACTIALYKDGSLRIASWPELASGEADMLWFRQTPECMWENDKLHAGLQAGAGLKKWGSTVDGETVIRRSGIGLNPERSVLFVAITNHTSARVLADGLHHAGATDVAQLDVNWSYPKFVTFEPIGRTSVLHPVPLAPGFEYSDDEYLRKKEKRDFFYILRKEPEPKSPH
ncbi:MAG TPA: hypothetical protein VHW01_26135 [Polyangiaceae bacterium]|jgi:hypothetical protein|nr:hypothetical protein [Polyangiaceae bacterium]